MTTLTLDLPQDVYQRLVDEADRMGEAVEMIASTRLAEQLRTEATHDVLPQTSIDEPERTVAVLREAGLLTELDPQEQAQAAQSTGTLQDVQAAFARVGGKPLSDIVNEMRGPKG